MSLFENVNDNMSNNEEMKEALQYSFFKKNLQNSTEASFCHVINFDIDDEWQDREGFSKKREEFNDQKLINDNHLSTKSTRKSDDNYWTGNIVQGSESEILFSGYFGQKVGYESKTEMMNNFFKSTNPFPEEEKTLRDTRGRMENDMGKFKQSSRDKSSELMKTCQSKILTNKSKLDGNHTSNFNGFYLSTNLISGINMTPSASCASFNDLVKNVSLSNTNKKKKSKLKF